MTESKDVSIMDKVNETTNEIIEMIVERYGHSDTHSPMRMTTATFMALHRMLNAYGQAKLTLAFAMELQAVGLEQLEVFDACDDECDECEEEAATNE